MTDPVTGEAVERLTRPIIGMENRTPLEVFDIMCDRIRAALTKSPPVTEWQPIETAPRDGTDILAVIAGNHVVSGDPFIPEVVSWEDADEGGYWWNCMWVGVDVDRADYEPTHWQPLPEPPAMPAKEMDND